MKVDPPACLPDPNILLMGTKTDEVRIPYFKDSYSDHGPLIEYPCVGHRFYAEVERGLNLRIRKSGWLVVQVRIAFQNRWQPPSFYACDRSSYCFESITLTNCSQSILRRF